MRISFIGSGNVATHLAKAFYKANHQIIQIFSRKQENADVLAKQVDAHPIHSLNHLDTEIDLVFICVPDQFITEISLLIPPYITQIHTSGNTMLSQLKGEKTGVFYPLQTFSKDKNINFSELNVLLESEDKETLKHLSVLAENYKKQHTLCRF